jgi:hypothetical protein
MDRSVRAGGERALSLRIEYFYEAAMRSSDLSRRGEWGLEIGRLNLGAA